jgi:hypothetical protein
MIRSAIPIVNQTREFTFMEIINRAFRNSGCDKRTRRGHRFLAAIGHKTDLPPAVKSIRVSGIG